MSWGSMGEHWGWQGPPLSGMAVLGLLLCPKLYHGLESRAGACSALLAILPLPSPSLSLLKLGKEGRALTCPFPGADTAGL